MLKRFTKSGKKQSKSGVILITILFILAVAFILIGSALIMTANTRKRLYSFAESSQARLTVTSAAQLFEDALQRQQISDDDFETLCTHDAVVWFTDTDIPGMGDHNLQPDNCTFAKFDVQGSKRTVSFTTVIDDETENILLTYDLITEPSRPSPFAFQVELGEGGRLDKVDIGDNISGGRANYDDNVVVSRGPVTEPGDSCDFYSTFVTTKPLKAASGAHYYGDLVFAGDDAAFNMAGGGTGAGAMMYGGSVFFLECDNIVSGNPAGTATRDMIHAEVNTTQVYFSNVSNTGIGSSGNGTMERPFLNFVGNSIFYLDYNAGTGAFTGRAAGDFSVNELGAGVVAPGATGMRASSTTSKDITYYIGNLEQYTNTEYVAPGQTLPRPSCFEDFVAQTNGIDGYTAPAGASTLSSSTENVGTAYRIPGGTTISTEYVINLQDSHDTVVYIEGDVTFSDGGRIIVKGDDGKSDSKLCYFILAPGAQIKLTGDNHPTGFFSDNVHGAGSITDPVVQTQTPIIYIIGSGTNGDSTLAANGAKKGQISCDSNQGNYIQAMVALYPRTDLSNDGGDFYTRAGGACHFYGRIICHTLLNAGGSHLDIPYCPQFTSAVDPNALVEVHSQWTCISFDYYYDSTDTSATRSGLHQ